MKALVPGMPLEELAQLFTPEEHEAINSRFQAWASPEPGKALWIRNDMFETVKRGLTAMALDEYSERIRAIANEKLRLNESGADEYMERALQSVLKARAADPSLPVILLHLAETLEMAGRLDEASSVYIAFIREQSQYLSEEGSQELIDLAESRLQVLGRGA